MAKHPRMFLLLLLPAATMVCETYVGSQPPPEVMTVKGIALQPDGQIPWKGATVLLHRITEDDEPTELVQPMQPGEGVQASQSDDRGEFAFEKLTAGEYWVQVQDAQGVVRNARLTVREGQPPPRLTIIMSPLELQGTVRRFENGPVVAKANVEMNRRISKGEGYIAFSVGNTQTGGDGRFVFRHLEEGEYELTAYLSGKDPLAGSVTLLLAPFTVRGVVLRPNGPPAVGAIVVLTHLEKKPPVVSEQPERNPDAVVTWTDASGKFAFPHVGRGMYWLYTRSEEGEVRVLRMGIDDTAPEPCRLLLTRTTVAGTVLLPDNRTPVAEARVLLHVLDQEGHWRWTPFAARTSGHGEFRFAGLDAGAYALQAETPRQFIAETRVTVSPESTARIRLVLPERSLEGAVVTPQGQPVAGVRVVASLSNRSPSMTHQANTDAAGRFRLRHVSPGTYLLQVQGGKGKIRNLEVNVPADRAAPALRVTLYPFRPKVVFHFEGPNGQPMGQAEVSSVLVEKVGESSYGGASGHGHGRLDEPGRLEYETNDAGVLRYLFVFPGLGYVPPGTLTVPEGTPQIPQRVSLKPGGTISGTVREEGSLRPVGGVALTPLQVCQEGAEQPIWNHLFSAMHHAVLVPGYPITGISRDGDGTFRISHLPPGEYEFRVGDQTRRCLLKEGQAVQEFDFIVPREPDSQSVSGRVLQPDGVTPLAATEVTLTVFLVERGHRMPWPRRPGVPRRVLTDAQGGFRLYPVTSENYWVTASAPGQEKSERPTITVKDHAVEGAEFVMGREP